MHKQLFITWLTTFVYYKMYFMYFPVYFVAYSEFSVPVFIQSFKKHKLKGNCLFVLVSGYVC